MKKAVPYIAIVLSAVSIMINAMMFKSQKNIVTVTELEVAKKELDARITWVRDGEADRHKIASRQIVKLINDVESLKNASKPE
jgi:hypothetical protein